MKKVLFSLLFLFLISISSESFAQSAGCNGTPDLCADRATQGLCEGFGGTGCTFTAATASVAASCAGTANACSTFTNATSCKASPSCYFNSSGDANDNAFVTTMCNALKIVTGNGGKAFAAFAIISVGIGFFTGKISWGLMIGVTAGIAAMFGAPTIVAAIAGGNALDCGS